MASNSFSNIFHVGGIEKFCNCSKFLILSSNLSLIFSTVSPIQLIQAFQLRAFCFRTENRAFSPNSPDQRNKMGGIIGRLRVEELTGETSGVTRSRRDRPQSNAERRSAGKAALRRSDTWDLG